METKYVGSRTKQGSKIEKISEGDEPEALDVRLDLANHSSTGFQWAYGGSGPAQTALAILADATGNDRLALSLHQDFKWAFIAKADPQGFELTQVQVQEWAEDAAKKLDPSGWEEEFPDDEGED